ncbi:MarR family winged helix-turn-helix transcriptional regulator [Actinacidiphila paucisporea]|uniref:DNA-binding transcriptional regulator, MarR family n=1 Tax=Actinacidiphila paucisporea TaxID=310782 RepID=A0A1M7MGI0_9ACTN|nr:MarR family transcriptional regulator [Actinacidiphila paucisporea]SHM89899.1 DNA-binding transcriptional regulator, MarR family [Actinacidiphila paucisporea]
MREAHTYHDQHASLAAPGIGGLLELLETAWEHNRASLSTAPLSSAQTRVMYIIDREPGINLSTLGQRLCAAAPSVTRLCDRLQAAGFLRRIPHAEDRRATQLELTEAGISHLNGIRHRREQILRQAMERMGPGAQRALVVGLSALCEAVVEPAQQDERGRPETA